jgi:uncharacterized protein (DUF58 family)
MSLTRRTLVLAALIVLLAIVGLWSPDPALSRLWLAPAALLLLALAVEGALQRRVRVEARMTDGARARLGRPHELSVEWFSTRPATLRVMTGLPAGLEAPAQAVTVSSGPRGTASRIAALPVGLGRHAWPMLRGRVRGALGLAWWTRQLRPQGEVRVEPDLLGRVRPGKSLAPSGIAQRAVAGSGTELHELRAYRRGDPLRAIDWKASARRGYWIARDRFAEQHLEIMMVLDVGRTSAVALDALTRLGHYVNAACRFSEHAVQNEDRIGLVTFADVPLVSLAPAHGTAAVRRLRAALAGAASLARESNPLLAAARVLTLSRQRALVVFMLDLDDVGSQGQLAQAVRLLTPKHLPVVCGLLNPELFDLRDGVAGKWIDPYLGLAASEQITRLRSSAAALRQLGAPVVLASPAQFEDSVFSTYDRMRARRRV